jgi:SOS response regulatory protein OraA/RecX
MARAAARLETNIKGRGPARTRQKLKALGLADDDIARAIDAALEEVDVATLLDRALEKRLRRERGDVRDPAVVRRVVGALVRQGFAPRAILARLRAKGADSLDE